ncbi:DUF6531 domain-containing protein [Mesorhizobium sp. NPDC059025]|uniref:DUF6531 domain-containing protein n=1 Tax=unclassified Mesorhizobium TaxID=325217 RepID=UPI003695E91A
MIVRNAFASVVRIVLVAVALIFSPPKAGNAMVDTRNANYYESWTDVTEKLGVDVVRTYNSRSLFDGMFGFGWCSDFETSVYLNDQGSYQLSFCGAGLSVEFAPRQLGEARGRVQTAEDGSTLEIENQQFLYRSADGKKTFHFDRMGQLSAIETPGFGTVRIVRRYGMIAEVFDWEGRVYRFSTNSARKVVRIRTPDGLQIEYLHNQNGELTSVKNVWNNVYTYSYNDLKNLVRATWPDATFIEIEYNREKDWVIGFVDRDQCKETYEYKKGPRAGVIYWSSMVKRCKEKLVAEGLDEFVFTGDSSLEPERLWKLRESAGLTGPGGVHFKETIYPKIGPPTVRQETRDSLHTPLLIQQ